MPLIDIAISRPCSCFSNNILAFRSEARFHNKFVTGNGKKFGLASVFSWKTIFSAEKLRKTCNLERMEVWRGGLTVKAVATVEINSLGRKHEGLKDHQNVFSMYTDSVRSNAQVCEPQSSNEDSTQVDEREKLRRMGISKANKGNTPWNKGRKHSPETLRKIKERTRLAMQDPKVKMKLVNLGHAQTDETRMKIGVGVRLGWEKRREKLMLQETCHYEWQNLIAVASGMGLRGEDELQYDSYKVLDEELEKDWLESVEQKNHTPRPKGSKKAPKSAEQRRKISAAIAAKWADPGYRDRVCSGLAKFHGISESVERKPRKKPIGDGQTRKNTKKKGEVETSAKREMKSPSQRIVLKKRKTLVYKDPLACSKLEMLKNIRAQRAATVNKKTEAITRARLLIAEAEKAAEALQIAAQNSPLAQASLMESRMLIAEAIQFFESIEEDDAVSYQNEAELKPVPVPDDWKEVSLDIVSHRKVNRFQSGDEFSFEKFVSSNLIEENATDLEENATDSCCGGPDDEEIQQTTSKFLHEPGEELQGTTSNGFLSPELGNTTNLTMNLNDPKPSPNGSRGNMQVPFLNGLKFQSLNAEAPPRKVNIIKKWVRGKLVEVEEET